MVCVLLAGVGGSLKFISGLVESLIVKLHVELVTFSTASAVLTYQLCVPGIRLFQLIVAVYGDVSLSVPILESSESL